MKVIIALMLLTLCSLSYAASTIFGGYIQVTPANIKNNAEYWSLVDFGAQAIVAKARASHKLSNVKDIFKVSAINSLYKQTMSDVNYKYDVKLVNSNKTIIINAKFVVYYQSQTKTKSVKIISCNIANNKKKTVARIILTLPKTL